MDAPDANMPLLQLTPLLEFEELKYLPGNTLTINFPLKVNNYNSDSYECFHLVWSLKSEGKVHKM